MANFGIGNREVDYAENWLGAPLLWSSFDADGQRAALKAAGFELIIDRVEATIEDGQPHPFLLVVARNAKSKHVVGPERRRLISQLAWSFQDRTKPCS